MYKQRTHKENQEVYVHVLAQGYYRADLNIHVWVDFCSSGFVGFVYKSFFFFLR